MTHAQRTALVLGVSALFLWAYWPIHYAGFVYEDLAWWRSSAPVLALRPRMLMSWSWWLQGIHTQAPIWFHLVNLGLHLVNGVLLWWLLRRLGASAMAAWLATGLFLLHRSIVEPAMYLSARPELIAGGGVLIACMLMAGRWWCWSAVLGVIGALVYGLGGKETALVGFGLLPLVTVASGSWRQAPRAWRWAVGVAWAIACSSVAVWTVQHRIWTIGLDGDIRSVNLNLWSWWMRQSAAIQRAVSLAIWPFSNQQTIDFDYDRLSHAECYWAAGLLVAFGLMILMLGWRHRLALCGLAWFVLTLIPRLLIPTPRGYLNDHQMYLPLVGLAMIAASCWDAITTTDAERTPYV